MRRELLGFWLALHLHDMEGILQTTCACAFICLEASGWWHGNAAGNLQGPAHGSETLGLASGPATHQPFDLGRHDPTFFSSLRFAYTTKIVIPTLHSAQNYWDYHMR